MYLYVEAYICKHIHISLKDGHSIHANHDIEYLYTNAGTVKLLLEAGGHADLPDSKGVTPLRTTVQVCGRKVGVQA